MAIKEIRQAAISFITSLPDKETSEADQKQAVKRSTANLATLTGNMTDYCGLVNAAMKVTSDSQRVEKLEQAKTMIEARLIVAKGEGNLALARYLHDPKVSRHLTTLPDQKRGKRKQDTVSAADLEELFGEDFEDVSIGSKT